MGEENREGRMVHVKVSREQKKKLRRLGSQHEDGESGVIRDLIDRARLPTRATTGSVSGGKIRA